MVVQALVLASRWWLFLPQTAVPGVPAGYRAPAPSGKAHPVAFGRRSERLKPLDEAAAYARCHGDRDEASVKVVKLPPRRARYELLTTGEEIRKGLEKRIDAREIDAPA